MSVHNGDKLSSPRDDSVESTRPRRTSSQTQEQQGGGHAGDDKEDDAQRRRAEAFAAFEATMKEELGRQKDLARNLLQDASLDATSVEAVERLFDNAGRSASAAGEELHEVNRDVNKKQLKAQQVTFAMKLETSRTANDVAMNNQKVEMEATAHRQLENKIKEFANNEGAALADAHATIEQVREELCTLQVAAKSTDEALKTTQKLLHASEARVSKSETNLASEREAHAADQQALRDALKGLDVFKDENRTLSEQIKDLVDSCNTATRERDELYIRLPALEAERDAARKELAEAGEKAAQAQEEHLAEMARLREELEEGFQLRLKDAVDSAVADERASAAEQLALRDAKEAEMKAEYAALEERLAAANARIGEGDAAVKKVEAALAAAVEEAAKAGAGAAAELAKAQKEIERLNGEGLKLKHQLEQTSGELSAVKAELEQKKKEEGTLGARLKELEAENAKLEALASTSKQQIESLQAQLTAASEAKEKVDEQLKQVKPRLQKAEKELADAATVAAVALQQMGLVMAGEAVAEAAAGDGGESPPGGATAPAPSASAKVQRLADAAQGYKKEVQKVTAQLVADLMKAGTIVKEEEQNDLPRLAKRAVDELNAMRTAGDMESLEISRLKGQLEEAFSSIGLLATDKKSLTAQVAELVNKFKQQQDERKVIEDSLSEALKSIRSLTGDKGKLTSEKAKLSDKVEDLVRRFKESQSELAKIRQSLADALGVIGRITNDKRKLTQESCKLIVDKRNLSDSVTELVENHKRAVAELERIKLSLADALRGLGVLADDKRRLSSDKLALGDRVTDLAQRWKDACNELARIKKALADALASVHGLTGEKHGLMGDRRKLSEKVADLIEAYRATKIELRAARVEAEAASNAEVDARHKAHAQKAEADRERAVIVHSAMKSLHAMRTHVAQTASGVRVVEPVARDYPPASPPPIHGGGSPPGNTGGGGGDPVSSFLSWDHPSRWGATEPKSELVLVSLHAPVVPPLGKNHQHHHQSSSPTPPPIGLPKPGGASPRLKRGGRNKGAEMDWMDRLPPTDDENDARLPALPASLTGDPAGHMTGAGPFKWGLTQLDVDEITVGVRTRSPRMAAGSAGRDTGTVTEQYSEPAPSQNGNGPAPAELPALS